MSTETPAKVTLAVADLRGFLTPGRFFMATHHQLDLEANVNALENFMSELKLFEEKLVALWATILDEAEGHAIIDTPGTIHQSRPTFTKENYPLDVSPIDELADAAMARAQYLRDTHEATVADYKRDSYA